MEGTHVSNNRLRFNRLLGPVLVKVIAIRPMGSEAFDHVRKHGAAFSGLPPHIRKAVVQTHISGAIAGDLDASETSRLTQ